MDIKTQSDELVKLQKECLRLIDDACPPGFYADAEHNCGKCDEGMCLACWIEWLPECGDGQGWLSRDEHNYEMRKRMVQIPQYGGTVSSAPAADDGTSESRADMERKAAALDRLESAFASGARFSKGSREPQWLFLYAQNNALLAEGDTLFMVGEELLNAETDCATCTHDCTDRGKPHNERSLTAEECAEIRTDARPAPADGMGG